MGSPASGPNEFSLQCSIETASEQWPGRPVIVKGTLHNAGDRSTYILPWTTFLESAGPDCVSIIHNGARVEYVGPTAQPRSASLLDFIEIVPGQSRSAEIDVSEHYNVWMSGEYELSFRMTVTAGHKGMFVNAQDTARSLAVQSGTIRFRMAGAKPPLFDGMTEGWEAAFRDSYRWAYESIVAGLVDVQHRGPGYQVWFDKNRGDGWQQRHQTVLTTLKSMIDWLSTDSLLIRTAPEVGACSGDRLGVTRPLQKGAIELCPKAFIDWWLRQAFGSAHRGRAFLLVHEISHAAGGTQDKSYDYGECQKFAETDPDSAIVNAQNYAMFALSGYALPTSARPDNGIWSDRAVSGGGGRAEHGPAAIEVSPNVVMVAYHEPEPAGPQPDAIHMGGQLCYKVVELFDNGYGWKNAIPFRPAFEIRKARELKSLVTPALARWNDETYCVYVDVELGLVTLKARNPGGVGGPPSWQELNWVGTWSEAEPELISHHRDSTKRIKLSPALAAYAGGGGKGMGLYCAYVDSDGILMCVAKFGSSGGGLGRWTLVNFDKPRKSTSSPALAVFQNQLKCAYRDADKSRYVILTYQAAGPDQPGTWVEDNSFPDLETSTIALGEWETAEGPRLLAVGSVIPVKGTIDKHLRYAVLSSDCKWSNTNATEEYTSYGVPALVSWKSARGRLLYAFLTGRDRNIESIKARS